jgi:hypothetical protein
MWRRQRDGDDDDRAVDRRDHADHDAGIVPNGTGHDGTGHDDIGLDDTSDECTGDVGRLRSHGGPV